MFLLSSLLSCFIDSLNQVNLQEKADLQEKEAQRLLDSGKLAAVTVKNLLETLCKPDQNPLFYAGGIEILTEMMKDCKPGMRMAWPCEYSQCKGTVERSAQMRQRIPMSLPSTNSEDLLYCQDETGHVRYIPPPQLEHTCTQHICSRHPNTIQHK